MSIDSTVDKENALVITTVKGIVSDNEFMAHIMWFANHPDIQSHFRHLMDFREIIQNDVTSKRLYQAADMTPFGHNSKRAFVIKRDLERGTANMFIKRISTDTENFYITEDFDDALKWVTQER